MVGGVIRGERRSTMLDVMEKGEGVFRTADLAKGLKKGVEQLKVKWSFKRGKEGIEGFLCIQETGGFENGRKVFCIRRRVIF